ncbi:M1 family aminopeptidase [Hymenobacter actinosclerus]|uniref:Peptidase M1 membrane alanine aminopeptidase domain-containing protein n=1 Tax=Hymenobacter actinosclerus TaxID=82805 RepID=A0A1I0ESQ1_9BACT|nr:M1 family aminopeptidase [Hymenobacter actinosclerus]SET48566.1 hypothetical protein SAMN04487998_1984 [Hymenobacter actinosclerus]
MKRLLLFLLLTTLSASSPALATPSVRVTLQVEPEAHTFTCRYRFTLPASDTTSVVLLNLNRRYKLQQVQAPRAVQQSVTRVAYSIDTLQQIQVRYGPNPRRSRYIELVYTGNIDEGNYTDHVNFLSAHSLWLPFRPYQEYEIVPYQLTVRVPPGYQVRSTRPPSRQQAGRYTFAGTTSAIELTALVARQFYQAASTTGPPITFIKTGAPLTATDSVMLRRAAAIVAYYNRTIGRQDTISHFTAFLPGTNSGGAYGLLDNATIIPYSNFNVAETEDLLILAHEISHKWWGYGSFHDETDWLNEAFATYSSLLYLQASGDEAGYQQELARLAQSTAGTPPLWGFDRYKYEYPMHRRVMYNKGTGILHALRTRIGTEQFLNILATSAAQKTSTNPGFVRLVEQVAGPETGAWLLAELKR